MVEIGSQHPQHLRDELQLVVLHPHGRALGGGFRRRLGEPSVDVDVTVPPLAVVDRLDDDVVIQRPQRRVGEALVVLGDVVGGQTDRAQPHVVLLDGLVAGIGNARPSDPRAAPAAQKWLQGGDETARAPFPRRGAVRQPFHVDRQPVGHHDEVRVPGADLSATPRSHLRLDFRAAQCRASRGKPGTRRRRLRTRRRRAWPGVRCCRLVVRRRRARRDQISQAYDNSSDGVVAAAQRLVD